ncbi:Hypothetical_protein [Hexamita inflata]|uniref:Hypothetical_protein n=1 Tax=Hexamita inflata TaxID=28002 RepID=A0AA86NI80_9EUKA|nr:Hypothetical protein HINF_LOCUS7193 [Hexamita inflata]
MTDNFEKRSKTLDQTQISLIPKGQYQVKQIMFPAQTSLNHQELIKKNYYQKEKSSSSYISVDALTISLNYGLNKLLKQQLSRTPEQICSSITYININQQQSLWDTVGSIHSKEPNVIKKFYLENYSFNMQQTSISLKQITNHQKVNNNDHQNEKLKQQAHNSNTSELDHNSIIIHKINVVLDEYCYNATPFDKDTKQYIKCFINLISTGLNKQNINTKNNNANSTLKTVQGLSLLEKNSLFCIVAKLIKVDIEKIQNTYEKVMMLYQKCYKLNTLHEEIKQINPSDQFKFYLKELNKPKFLKNIKEILNRWIIEEMKETKGYQQDIQEFLNYSSNKDIIWSIIGFKLNISSEEAYLLASVVFSIDEQIYNSAKIHKQDNQRQIASSIKQTTSGYKYNGAIPRFKISLDEIINTNTSDSLIIDISSTESSINTQQLRNEIQSSNPPDSRNQQQLSPTVTLQRGPFKQNYNQLTQEIFTQALNTGLNIISNNQQKEQRTQKQICQFVTDLKSNQVQLLWDIVSNQLNMPYRWIKTFYYCKYSSQKVQTKPQIQQQTIGNPSCNQVRLINQSPEHLIDNSRYNKQQEQQQIRNSQKQQQFKQSLSTDINCIQENVQLQIQDNQTSNNYRVIQNINDALETSLLNASQDINNAMAQSCWSDVKSFINLIKSCLKILNIDASTFTLGNTLNIVRALDELEKKSLWDELTKQIQVNQKLIQQTFNKVYKFYELWYQNKIKTKQKETGETANPGSYQVNQIENNYSAQDSKIEILNTELNDQPNPNEHIISQQLLSNTPVQNQEQNSQLSNAKLSAEMQNTLKPITYNVSQNNNYHKQDQNDVQSTELEKAAEVQNNTIQRHNGMQDPLSVKVEQTNQIPQTHCNEPEQQIQLEINLSHHSQSPEKQPEPAIHIPTTQPSTSKNSVQTQAKFSQGLKYAILTLFSKDLEDKTDQQLIAFLNKNLNSQTVQKFWSVVELHSNQGADYYQKQFMRCLYDQITVQQKQMIQNYLSEQKELLNEKSTAQIAKQIKKALFKEQNVFIHDIVQIVENNQ